MCDFVPLIHLSIEQTLCLKGVSIILVLLQHTGYTYLEGPWGVGLFLLLSGYGLCASFQKDGLSRFWRKKFCTVFLPYYPVALVQLFVLGFTSNKQLLFTLLGLDFCVILDKTMWYLSFLLFWYIAFFIGCHILFTLRRLTQHQSLFWPLPAFLLGCIVPCLMLESHDTWGGGAGANLYVWFFPVGAAFFCLSRKKVSPFVQKFVWLTLSLMGLLIVCRLYKKPLNTTFLYTIYIVAGALLLLSICQLCTLHFPPLEKVLTFFGRYSYTIYLWESFFLSLRNSWFSFLDSQLLIDCSAFSIIILVSLFYQRFISSQLSKTALQICQK